jgi:hypothetical protein
VILDSKPSPFVRFLSWLVFNVPGRPAAKMAEFSHTETGSALDMITAAEETARPELRAKFFRHALDEHKHARLFAQRAVALSGDDGRVRALVEDSAFINSRGIRGKEPLCRQMSEVEFFAFIWVHELAGARQFDIYAKLMQNDPASAAMFADIGKDERFHIAYSRAELDRIAASGRAREVKRAVFITRWRRFRNVWLRGSRNFGAFMSGIWLTIFYFLVLGPFALISRFTERPVAGFIAPGASPAGKAESQA